MNLGEMLSAFVTLLLVIDPIGLAPIFVAMTQGRGNAQRRAIAFRACAIAAGILTLRKVKTPPATFTGAQLRGTIWVKSVLRITSRACGS